jgi:hypothetical protein
MLLQQEIQLPPHGSMENANRLPKSLQSDAEQNDTHLESETQIAGAAAKR